MSLPWWLAIIVVVIVNTLLGWLTGAVINKTKIVPMIGTMAISTIISGIAYLLCGGLPISGLPDIVKFFYQGNVGPIPMPIVIAAVIVVIMGIIFKYTYFGRQIFATGSNREAARLSGINADRIFVSCYTICGTLCSIAALLMIGRMGSGQPNCGDIGYGCTFRTGYGRCQLPWRRRKSNKGNRWYYSDCYADEWTDTVWSK